MGQLKANIKPEYEIKENERFAWVWRCVRLTSIPGQARQDVREWNYVAFNERDHLRFKNNFAAANVHEAFLIHDGARERKLEKEKGSMLDKAKDEHIENAKKKAELLDKTKKELIALAEEEMVEVDARMTKKEIVDKILEA
jgi:hypothetical protein